MTIPFHRVAFGVEEIDAVLNELDDNWLSPRGPRGPEFGARWAKEVGHRYGWPCSSGTAAIHLALLALGVGPGDRVAVPTYTCSPTVYPVTYVGAEPVFVDCERTMYGMDPGSLADVLRIGGIKAVIAVHLYGASCMPEVLELCERYQVPVIEDACESVGALYWERPGWPVVGGKGPLGTFSFRGDKVLTALGTGGIVTTDDPNLFRRVQYFCDLGLHNDQTMGRYRDLPVVGFNYEMSNPAAAFGLKQIDRLPEIIAGRQRAASWWREQLSGRPGIRLMPHYPGHVYYQMALAFDRLADDVAAPTGLDRLGEALLAHGVPLIPPFSCMHEQPAYRKAHGRTPVLNAKWAEAHVLLFPCYPALTQVDVLWLAETITETYYEVVHG